MVSNGQGNIEDRLARKESGLIHNYLSRGSWEDQRVLEGKLRVCGGVMWEGGAGEKMADGDGRLAISHCLQSVS